MARALSVDNILNYAPETLPFEGEWRNHIGLPELCGGWIVSGESFNGKTRYVLQLCKYLCTFENVLYNSLEEGLCKSFQDAIKAVGMKDVGRRFKLLSKEPIEELKERLRKPKSPKIIVIDSIQYSGMTYRDYVKLINDFPSKLFIMISHAEGKRPMGTVAYQIWYDAFVKIRIEGYRAFIQSRYGGGKIYTIWEFGASEYWGNI